jgi:hypothetical protein
MWPGAESRVKAESGSPANLRECPLGGEPPFLPGTTGYSKRLLSPFDIYFSDGLF